MYRKLKREKIKKEADEMKLDGKYRYIDSTYINLFKLTRLVNVETGKRIGIKYDPILKTVSMMDLS